jgi:hypothetical protein
MSKRIGGFGDLKSQKRAMNLLQQFTGGELMLRKKKGTNLFGIYPKK